MNDNNQPLEGVPQNMKYGMAAAAGAAIALVMALFTPAAVLLALECAAGVAVYLYQSHYAKTRGRKDRDGNGGACEAENM